MTKAPSKASAAPNPTSNKLQRRPFVADIMKHRGNGLVVTGLGSPTWDLFAAGDRPDNLYSWGGMGLAVPTALGLALAQPDRRVLAMTGDGEMMMRIGSLGVVAPGADDLVRGHEAVFLTQLDEIEPVEESISPSACR